MRIARVRATPWPGQLTKLSRLRNAPSRRVAEPNCQTAALPPNITRENKNGCEFEAKLRCKSHSCQTFRLSSLGYRSELGGTFLASSSPTMCGVTIITSCLPDLPSWAALPRITVWPLAILTVV